MPTKSYKDQYLEHMIRNVMWDVLSLPDPVNTEKKWDLLLHQYIFHLDYLKRHAQSFQKGSEEDQYIVQNSTCSGMYLRSTMFSDFFQKIQKLMPLTGTGPEVYVATMNTVLSDSYDSLVDTMNHMKMIKLKIYPGEKVTDLCATILVDAKRLESAGSFKHELLVYITRIF